MERRQQAGAVELPPLPLVGLDDDHIRQFTQRLEGEEDTPDRVNLAAFFMYGYKVLLCPKQYSHDWGACPYAHPKENARRRDPQRFAYSSCMCPNVGAGKGLCPMGLGCSYAHTLFEYWLHPSRFRTQMCKQGTQCKRSLCFFAHSQDELRTPGRPAAASAPFAGGDAAASTGAVVHAAPPAAAAGNAGTFAPACSLPPYPVPAAMAGYAQLVPGPSAAASASSSSNSSASRLPAQARIDSSSSLTSAGGWAGWCSPAVTQLWQGSADASGSAGRCDPALAGQRVVAQGSFVSSSYAPAGEQGAADAGVLAMQAALPQYGAPAASAPAPGPQQRLVFVPLPQAAESQLLEQQLLLQQQEQQVLLAQQRQQQAQAQAQAQRVRYAAALQEQMLQLQAAQAQVQSELAAVGSPAGPSSSFSADLLPPGAPPSTPGLLLLGSHSQLLPSPVADLADSLMGLAVSDPVAPSLQSAGDSGAGLLGQHAPPGHGGLLPGNSHLGWM